MATINSIDLGEIKSETDSKSSNLFMQALPFTDSDSTLLMDLLGANRTITLSGVKTGTTAECNTFIDNIEALQDADQGSGFTFVSSWRTSPGKDKTVLIEEFTHDKVEADESRVTYTLVLFEGSGL